MNVLSPNDVDLGGAHLVEASAGTGKTYTIATLFVRLLLERRIDVRHILVVTYTRAATAELRDRIRARITQVLAEVESGRTPSAALAVSMRVGKLDASSAAQRLRDALVSFDEAAIHTIHGFCQRVLQESSFESRVPFDAELVVDEGDLIEEIVHDFWSRTLAAATDEFLDYVHAMDWGAKQLTRVAWAIAADPAIAIVPPRVDSAIRPVAPSDGESRDETPGEVDGESRLGTVAQVDGESRDAVARWHAAFVRARGDWQQNEAALLQLLAHDPRFNRARIRTTTVEQVWWPALRQTFSGDRPRLTKSEKEDWRQKLCIDASVLKKGYKLPDDAFFASWRAFCAAERDVRVVHETALLHLMHEFCAFVRVELSRRKRALGVQTFIDLLLLVHGALTGPTGEVLAERLRQRYRAALVDEFQDTDPVQYEIFERMYADTAQPRFFIGDPKQAIFAFRNADVHAYLRAARSLQERAYTLATNYRSDPAVVTAINALFALRPDPFAHDDIIYRPVNAGVKNDRLVAADGGAALRFLLVERATIDVGPEELIVGDWSRTGVPRIVANEIATLLGSAWAIEGRPVRPSDIAVIVRKNAQAGEVQAALRRAGVPSVLQSEASVFDTDEALAIERLGAAMAEPSFAPALRTALADPMFGLDSAAIAKMVDEDDSPEWDAWVEKVQVWHARWIRYGFLPALRFVLDGEHVAARLLELDDGERRVTNLLHLGEVLHQAEVQHGFGPIGLVQWLSHMRAHKDVRKSDVGEFAQLRLESEADAVRIVTVHKSKGLEYPIVFCPYLWDAYKPAVVAPARFHDRDRADRLTLDLGPKLGSAAKAAVEHEEAAEALRLAYVALTRAKHACFVVWGAFLPWQRSALAYLLGLDTNSGKASDAMLIAPIEQLREQTAGSVDIVRVRDTLVTYDPPQPCRVVLAARETSREVVPAWSSSSFSRLVRRTPLQDPGMSELEIPAGDESMVVSAEAVVSPLDLGPVEGLKALPGGLRMGNLFHALLEQVDFQSSDAQVFERLANGQLERFGYSSSQYGAQLAEGLRNVLVTPIDADDPTFRLANVPTKARVHELEFTLRVQAGPRSFTAAVADALAPFCGEELPAQYAERVRSLDAGRIEGFMRGFVDLVIRHGGRYFVLDYKSNRLGVAADAHDDAALERAMISHHYVLQALIYALALHRHLQLRQRDYDYDRDFGGIRYLFLRAMQSDAPGRGVYRFRPSLALMTALAGVIHPAGKGGLA